MASAEQKGCPDGRGEAEFPGAVEPERLRQSACLLLIETIMLSLSRQFRPDRRIPRPATLRRGFTLIEIVIALAVLGTMAAGVYLGFNTINTYAVSSRLYSEAQTAAQNQIDLVLSREPFDITAAYISGHFRSRPEQNPH